MRLIVAAGMPGAGKEEFLTAVRTEGISFVRMGDIVRDFYSSSGAASKGMTVGQFAGSEREVHGPNIWAKRAIDRMSGDIFYVDGCRSMDEIRSFRALGGDVVIVAIHASPDVRYARLVKRARDDAPKDLTEFNARDSRELSWGVGEVMALSDRMIDNMSELDDFRRRSAEMVRSLR